MPRALFGFIAGFLAALVFHQPALWLFWRAGGWHTPLLITAFIVNGAWGIGTGLILRILSRTVFRNSEAQ